MVKRGLRVLILAAIALVFFVLFSSFISATLLSGGYDNRNFSSPVDNYAAKQIFTIAPEAISLTAKNQNVYINVTVNNPGGYIYKTGYYYSYNATNPGWIPFTFSEPTIGNSNWTADIATKQLLIPASLHLKNSNDNLIITYSCKKYNGLWRCGCHSDNKTCDFWMLQQFSVSGIGGGHGDTGYCSADSDCGVGTCSTGGNCVCSQNALLVNKKCECVSGFANCDSISPNGCESNLNTDTNNCGSCASACTSAWGSPRTCTNGACVCSGTICSDGGCHQSDYCCPPLEKCCKSQGSGWTKKTKCADEAYGCYDPTDPDQCCGGSYSWPYIGRLCSDQTCIDTTMFPSACCSDEQLCHNRCVPKSYNCVP